MITMFHIQGIWSGTMIGQKNENNQKLGISFLILFLYYPIHMMHAEIKPPQNVRIVVICPEPHKIFHRIFWTYKFPSNQKKGEFTIVKIRKKHTSPDYIQQVVKIKAKKSAIHYHYDHFIGIDSFIPFSYRVDAEFWNSNHTYSTSKSLLAKVTQTMPIPIGPSNLKAKIISSGNGMSKIEFNWKDNSTNEYGFYLEYRDNNKFKQFPTSTYPPWDRKNPTKIPANKNRFFLIKKNKGDYIGFFRIVAFNCNFSRPSNEVKIEINEDNIKIK